MKSSRQKSRQGYVIITLFIIALGLVVSDSFIRGFYAQEETPPESAYIFRPSKVNASKQGSSLLASPSKLIIEFGTSDYYSVWVRDDKVIGGYAQGSADWKILGGAFDGENLQIMMITADRSDCNEWWTHNFLVEVSQVTLRSSVNKCGEAVADRNVIYPRPVQAKPIQIVYFPGVLAPEITATPSEITLGFGDVDSYFVRVNNGTVTGGYAQGSVDWNILSGAFEGTDLQIIMITEDRADCNEWWSHNFMVEDSQVTLRTSVNKCGETIVDRNVVYPRTFN